MKIQNYLVVIVALIVQPVHAQGLSKGIDGKKPVEINADQLEVRQEENVAVFTGNVIAVQDDTRLKSDVMTVHYRKKEGEDESADPTQGAVERIDVEGNVLLTTPDESASGARGVYNVDTKKVTLLENVVLTRGKNILKGDSLVYDFATGKSVVNSPKHADDVKKTGRVKALFVPEKK
jgi:lipopolysaccharide export system protein LptA